MDATGRWSVVHGEREALFEILRNLDHDQWHKESLCPQWTVRHVVAHLAAAGSTATGAWMISMAGSGFNADRHNARLLKKFLGDSPVHTLENFRQSCNKSIAALNSIPGLLGEVLVHGQDITVPLGIELTPRPEAVRDVARFFVAKDFAVNSKSLAKSLKLVATDDTFASGVGPEVHGKLLDLVMALAGRRQYLVTLDGEGVGELKNRLG